MNQSYDYEAIEDYLAGRLSETEKMAFDAFLKSHPSFQEEVQFYKNLMQASVNVSKEDDFRATIQQVEATLEAENFFAQEATMKNNRFRSRRFFVPLAIAASFLMLLWFGLHQYGQANYGNEALAAAFFEDGAKDQLVGYSKRDANVNENVLQTGIDAFNEGAYKTAITEFSKIATQDAAYAESIYYLGRSHLADEAYSSAVQYFQMVEATAPWKEAAEWYQIEAMLKANYSTADITQQLNDIIENPNHAFFENATTLKAELNRFWRWF